jgi:hypothetical protein
VLYLSRFPDEAAEDFVALYPSGDQPFTPVEKAAILALARGYPLALEIACAEVRKAKESGASLESALRKAEEETKVHRPTW